MTNEEWFSSFGMQTGRLERRRNYAEWRVFYSSYCSLEKVQYNFLVRLLYDYTSLVNSASPYGEAEAEHGKEVNVFPLRRLFDQAPFPSNEWIPIRWATEQRITREKKYFPLLDQFVVKSIRVFSKRSVSTNLLSNLTSIQWAKYDRSWWDER